MGVSVGYLKGCNMTVSETHVFSFIWGGKFKGSFYNLTTFIDVGATGKRIQKRTIYNNEKWVSEDMFAKNTSESMFIMDAHAWKKIFWPLFVVLGLCRLLVANVHRWGENTSSDHAML